MWFLFWLKTSPFFKYLENHKTREKKNSSALAVNYHVESVDAKLKLREYKNNLHFRKTNDTIQTKCYNSWTDLKKKHEEKQKLVELDVTNRNCFSFSSGVPIIRNHFEFILVQNGFDFNVSEFCKLKKTQAVPEKSLNRQQRHDLLFVSVQQNLFAIPERFMSTNSVPVAWRYRCTCK